MSYEIEKKNPIQITLQTYCILLLVRPIRKRAHFTTAHFNRLQFR